MIAWLYFLGCMSIYRYKIWLCWNAFSYIGYIVFSAVNNCDLKPPQIKDKVFTVNMRLRFLSTWERRPLPVFLVPALPHYTDHLIALLRPLLRYHVHTGSLTLWHLQEDCGHAAPWHHKRHRSLDSMSTKRWMDAHQFRTHKWSQSYQHMVSAVSESPK